VDTLLVNGDAHDAHEGGKQSTVQEIWCQVLMVWRRRRRRRRRRRKVYSRLTQEEEFIRIQRIL